MTDTHYVYTFWNADDRALYVGCTSRLPQRLRQHMSEREWFGEVNRLDVTVYDDCAAGYAAEAGRIRELNPVHNSVYTDHRVPTRKPCASCHTGRHGKCLGLNRAGEVCKCSVCARDKARTAA